MEDIYDAIIIGGGACGLMCAVQAGYLGKKVLVLEKNAQPGAKILISGGGRCNYTNREVSTNNFISENEHFATSAFKQWTVDDTIQFFENFGIKGKEKTLGQLFPVNNKASDIVKVFLYQMKEMNIELKNDCEVSSVENKLIVDENQYQVNAIINGSKVNFKSKSLVIATGGLPIPKMGATDFGLNIAKQFGLRVTKTAPALVPLVVGLQDRNWYEKLSGISVFAKVSNDQISFEENILFTHWGLSGPAILQISSYWKGGEAIHIDLIPQLNLKDFISKERNINGGKLLSTILNFYLPKKLVDAFEGILPLDIKIASLSKDAINLIEKTIHQFELKPAGDKGYEKAEVMRGGVDTEELSSKTLESKKQPGLFFGGECVDVTGWLGGYNFQWAWASGYVIAQNI